MEIFGIGFALMATAFAVVLGLIALALPLLWVWMLIDSIIREEWEYPGSTAASNNRLLWALLIAFLQFPAVLYYFMVYAKAKRGMVLRPAWAYPPVQAPPAA